MRFDANLKGKRPEHDVKMFFYICRTVKEQHGTIKKSSNRSVKDQNGNRAGGEKMEDIVNEHESAQNQQEFEASDEVMENNPSADETPEEQAENGTAEDDELSFDDILAIPEFRSEFDRRISQAINTYVRRHATTAQQDEPEEAYNEQSEEEPANDNAQDIESLVSERIEAYMIATKFENCLDRALDSAGIVDKQGYLAHFDMQDLMDHYDPDTDMIVGLDEANAEMREEFPLYFGTDATGSEHGAFGGNSAPESLGAALRERYTKKH